MFPIAPKRNQFQQNINGQRHCILVAASNPHPFPTLVYQPQMQNLEQSKNTEALTKGRLFDVEAVAKLFAQVLQCCSPILFTGDSPFYKCL